MDENMKDETVWIVYNILYKGEKQIIDNNTLTELTLKFPQKVYYFWGRTLELVNEILI